MTKVDKSVLINREDFLAMLEPLKRFAKKKQVGDAALSMEDGDLVISFVGISTGAPATGNWSGEVRVPGRLIWGIAMVPPEGDPIRLEVRDGRLHIGTLSVSCLAQKTQKSAVNPLMDPELVKMLRLRLIYPLDRLDKAGLTRALVQAEEKARKIVGHAAKILAPLNISESDLMRMVKEHLRKGIDAE
ncbi:MAG: hypothetical protein WAN11_07295 [Syntrophobacteraceae bacterium]